MIAWWNTSKVRARSALGRHRSNQFLPITSLRVHCVRLRKQSLQKVIEPERSRMTPTSCTRWSRSRKRRSDSASTSCIRLRMIAEPSGATAVVTSVSRRASIGRRFFMKKAITAATSLS